MFQNSHDFNQQPHRDNSRMGALRGPRGFGGFGPGFGGPGPRPHAPGTRGGFDPRQAWGGHDSDAARRAPRGGIRLGLLLLIEEQPQNGYGLIKAFESKSNGQWTPGSGGVYPALNSLIEDSLAVVDDQGVYTLTEAGKAELEANRERIETMFQHMGTSGSVGELLSSSRAVMEALFHINTQGTAEQKVVAIEKLDALRKDLYRMLGE